MKKIIIFLTAIVIFTSCGNDNNNNTDSGFNTIKTLHENDKDATSLSMPAFIFKMFIKSDEKEVNDAVEQINDIDFFVKEKVDDTFNNDLKSNILKASSYKSIMSVNDDKANVEVLAKEQDKKIDEVLIIIDTEKESCVILRIGGDFNSESVKKLIEGIDIEKVSNYR